MTINQLTSSFILPPLPRWGLAGFRLHIWHGMAVFMRLHLYNQGIFHPENSISEFNSLFFLLKILHLDLFWFKTGKAVIWSWANSQHFFTKLRNYESFVLNQGFGANETGQSRGFSKRGFDVTYWFDSFWNLNGSPLEGNKYQTTV